MRDCRSEKMPNFSIRHLEDSHRNKKARIGLIKYSIVLMVGNQNYWGMNEKRRVFCN